MHLGGSRAQPLGDYRSNLPVNSMKIMDLCVASPPARRGLFPRFCPASSALAALSGRSGGLGSSLAARAADYWLTVAGRISSTSTHWVG